MIKSIKRRVAFHYDDWPYFFDYEQYRRHIEIRINGVFFNKQAKARLAEHYDRVTQHCFWMMSQQVPGWKTYRMYHHPGMRYGDTYARSCVTIEVDDE